MNPQIKSAILFFLCLGLFGMVIYFAAKKGAQTTTERYQEQYSAWTNYTKRTDVTLVEFIQLKDIGVLR